MKIKFLKLITFIAVACTFFSCQNSDDSGSDIDMSKIDFSNIDFSNIEDLHAQPLSVIQKCVEGKWKWYSSCCGYTGKPDYSDNTFFTIYNDKHVIEYYDGRRQISHIRE